MGMRAGIYTNNAVFFVPAFFWLWKLDDTDGMFHRWDQSDGNGAHTQQRLSLEAAR